MLKLNIYFKGELLSSSNFLIYLNSYSVSKKLTLLSEMNRHFIPFIFIEGYTRYLKASNSNTPELVELQFNLAFLNKKLNSL